MAILMPASLEVSHANPIYKHIPFLYINSSVTPMDAIYFVHFLNFNYNEKQI